MKHPLSPLPALLALALALTACAPAAPQSAAATETAPAAETAETALAKTAGEQAAFPVGHLQEIDLGAATDTAFYQLDTPWVEGEPAQTVLTRTDTATGATEVVYTFGEVQQSNAPFLVGDDVIVICDETLYKFPQVGGAPQTLPLEQPFSAWFYDEYGVYEFMYGQGKSNYTARRLDLETGQITELNLPPQTWQLCATGSDRFILCRLLTDTPLPDIITQSEFYAVVIQNATYEYDWYDPATGALEAILQEPYYGVDQGDGTRRQRRLLGAADGTLVFFWDHIDAAYTTLESGFERCDAGGEGWEPLPNLPENALAWTQLEQDGQLRWLICGPREGDLGVYDLANAAFYPRPDLNGYLVNWPYTFLGGGKLLVTVSTENSTGYALIDQADYLAGSTAWIPIQPYTG